MSLACLHFAVSYVSEPHTTAPHAWHFVHPPSQKRVGFYYPSTDSSVGMIFVLLLFVVLVVFVTFSQS